MNARKVKMQNTRTNELGSTVLHIFGKHCDELTEKLIEQQNHHQNGNVAVDDQVVEVEARLGVFDENEMRFVSGVSESHFKNMIQGLLSNVSSGTWKLADDVDVDTELVVTDYLDVIFEDRIRVTCKLERDKKSNQVNSIGIVEIISKSAMGVPTDFQIECPLFKNGMILRIGESSENHIPENSKQHARYVAAAKKVIFDSFNVRTTEKIFGGIEMRLTAAQGTQSHVYLIRAPEYEDFARGKMAFTDPLYSIADVNSMIPISVASQLKWTLMKPDRLPALRGAFTTELHSSDGKTELENKLLLTNLPGLLVFDDKSEYCAYACQYIIAVNRSKVQCGHGRFAKMKDSIPDDANDFDTPSLNVNLYRRKKRWSFKLRNDMKLDMTEIQTSKNPVTIFHEKTLYEVEVEKVLSASRISIPSKTNNKDWNDLNLAILSIKATKNADDFLNDITSRLFYHKLPELELQNLPNDEWRIQMAKDKERRQNLLSSFGVAAITSTIMDRTDQSGAMQFYNALKRNVVSRPDSLIYHMRCLNNFVKSAILVEAVGDMLDNNCPIKPTGINVIDLACGKGADVKKIIGACKESKDVCVDNYIGVDYARDSLYDAVKRMKDMNARDLPKKLRFIHADLGKHFLSSKPGDGDAIHTLEQWDSIEKVWRKKLPSETIQSDTKFHLVTMQFALHYMFQSRERAMHFFRSFSGHMATGGVFVATTVYADEMIARVMDAGPGATSFSIKDNRGVEACRVQFDDDFRQKHFHKYERYTGDQSQSPDEDMFGIRYTFSLHDGGSASDAAVNAPEWLVPLSLLLKLAAMHSLVVRRYERLPNFATHRMVNDYPNALHRRMNVLNHEGSISECEWQISSLYVVIELEKEEPPKDYKQALSRLKHNVPFFNTLPSEEKDEMLNHLLSNI